MFSIHLNPHFWLLFRIESFKWNYQVRKYNYFQGSWYTLPKCLPERSYNLYPLSLHLCSISLSNYYHSEKQEAVSGDFVFNFFDYFLWLNSFSCMYWSSICIFSFVNCLFITFTHFSISFSYWFLWMPDIVRILTFFLSCMWLIFSQFIVCFYFFLSRHLKYLCDIIY